MRVGWLSSAWDAQSIILLREVAAASAAGALGAQIDFVLSTKSPERSVFAQQLKSSAELYGIPFCHVDSAAFRRTGTSDAPAPYEPWRDALEASMITMLSRYSPDLVVMAGYLFWAGPRLLQQYKMINLHPYPSQDFSGSRPQVIRKMIAQGCRIGGAMIHVVDATFDGGPRLAYFRVPLEGPVWDKRFSGEDANLYDAIDELILQNEPHLLVQTLRLLSATDVRRWPPTVDRDRWPVEISVQRPSLATTRDA